MHCKQLTRESDFVRDQKEVWRTRDLRYFNLMATTADSYKPNVALACFITAEYLNILLAGTF